MYQLINQTHIDEFAKKHVVTLLDSFWQAGPNGNHQCLVFEPMGSIASRLLETFDYPLSEQDAVSHSRVKTISKQFLLGLHCLHSCEIAHGDVNPGNLLFSLGTCTVQSIPALVQVPTESNVSPPVKRLDGKRDRWAPDYLCFDQLLATLVDSERAIQTPTRSPDL